ncbi:MAG: right-handed parallel beta-helix repeat-containing protein [Clostridia bacterium]|nr:right-handed parallel beta-helix repeat-containing protein [Clostridia bacterium]
MDQFMHSSTLYVESVAALERALDLVRDFRAAGEDRPITIVLTADLYLTHPIELDVAGITLDGCGHRIAGGIKIENWQADTFNGVTCKSAKLPSGDWSFTDLWVDGRRADSPRYPKEGYLEVLDTEINHTGELLDSSKWFIADPTDLNGLAGLEDAIVNYYHFWIDEHTPIQSYDPKTGKLVMKYASRFRINTEEGSAAQIRYYLTHLPATFGAENEWYLDRKAGKVYYVGKVQEALAPTVPWLFRITADYVRILNAELTCTCGDYVSRVAAGHAGMEREEECAFASDIQSVCWAPGAVIFENAAGGSLEGCRLHGVGIHGVEIKTGCRAIRIENNQITDLGAGGIKIFGGAYGAPAEQMTTHCTLRGNEIAHCGKRYAAGCGILANHTAYLEISENHIHHTDYSGISVGWVWGYSKSSTYCNRICRNHIHHIGMGRLSDMGGIYLLGRQPGTVVSGNRIHHVVCANYGGWGIYTDEGSSDIVLENNVVFQTKSTSFHQHYGRNNVVRNNIFVCGGDGAVDIKREEPHTTAVVEGNILVTDGIPTYHESPGISTVQSRKNLLWDLCGEVRPAKDCTMEEWQSQGKDTGSIIADPLFTDAEHFDFTLSPESPALELGFQPIVGFPASEA